MAKIVEANRIAQHLTQKMGGCQGRKNTIHGSDHRFDPVYLHGEGSGSERKGKIQ